MNAKRSLWNAPPSFFSLLSSYMQFHLDENTHAQLQSAGGTGITAAVGTGKNASTAGTYGKENLGALNFELTTAEMKALDALGAY